MDSRDDLADQRTLREIRLLRARNRRLAEDLDEAECNVRVLRRLVSRLLVEQDALKQTIDDLSRAAQG